MVVVVKSDWLVTRYPPDDVRRVWVERVKATLLASHATDSLTLKTQNLDPALPTIPRYLQSTELLEPLIKSHLKDDVVFIVFYALTNTLKSGRRSHHRKNLNV